MDLRIKEILHEKGVSMNWLSKETNIASETLYRIGSRNPTIGTCEKIADALGVSFIELFEAKNGNTAYICSKCGAKKKDAASATLPANKIKTGDSLFDYIEKCSDTVGSIGLSKHLRAFSGGDVLVNRVDTKFYDCFIEYLQTAKKKEYGNIITETYKKRLKSCFDEILTLLPSELKILDTMNTD